MLKASRSTRVTLFRNFVEDRRFSMNVYADELGRALRAMSSDRFTFMDYVPTAPLRRGGDRVPSIWKMRLARYVTYPAAARSRQGDINHILDHGYAQLLCTIDGRRTVVTVHDMIPLAANRGKISGLRRYRPWLSELSSSFLKRARLLIADSENTKADLIEFCRIPDARIRVISQGLSRSFRVLHETNKDDLRRALGLPSSDVFLILISGRQFYKNPGTSLQVLRKLRQLGYVNCQIVWLGNSAARKDPDVASHGLENAVHGVEPQDVDTLVRIYNAVDCLLFPSLYEGFGWPPLEAMACGKPVVCSNAASLPEVVGDAALVASPTDVDTLVRHVVTVMDDSALRQSMIQRGLLRAAHFSWEKHASEVCKVYQEILS